MPCCLARTVGSALVVERSGDRARLAIADSGKDPAAGPGMYPDIHRDKRIFTSGPADAALRAPDIHSPTLLTADDSDLHVNIHVYA